MKLFLSIICVLSARLHAEDLQLLRSHGAKVMEVGGVIAQVHVKCDAFSEADFKTLGTFTSIKDLSISGKTITDEALGQLAGLTQLERLSMDGAQITDEGCRHFAAFQNLQTLSLFHPAFRSEKLTGSGLGHLKALPKLERLTFAGSTAGDAAMQAIGQLVQLKEFRTWHTAQTQEGNRELLRLKNLKALRIGQRLPSWGRDSPVSFDESTLEIIAKITTLESLELTEARLTAKILPQLQCLPRLTRLKFEIVDIPTADVDAIRSALPGCKVEFNPMSDAQKEALLVKKLRL